MDIITAVSSLIVSGTLKVLEKRTGETILNKVGQLVNTVRDKFRNEDVTGKLTKLEKDPNEKNKLKFERELEEQMKDDELFATDLRELIEQIEAEEKGIVQRVIKDIEAEFIKAKDIDVRAEGTVPTKQEVATNLKGTRVELEGISVKASGEDSEKKN